MCVCIHVSIYLSIYLSIHPYICLSVYLPVYLSIYLSIYLSMYLYLPLIYDAEYTMFNSKTKKAKTSYVFILVLNFFCLVMKYSDKEKG